MKDLENYQKVTYKNDEIIFRRVKEEDIKICR